MSHFATTLRRCRKDANLSQAALAAKLGVTRPTVTQWENDAHPPSSANVEKMDDVLEAGGELIRALAVTTRNPDHGFSRHQAYGALNPTAPEPQIRISDVLRGIGDRFRDEVVESADKNLLGWAHNLGDKVPTAYSTAVGIRTMQLLDRADIDLQRMASSLVMQQKSGAWSHQSIESPRPEVTAIALDALTRMGWTGKACEDAWMWLDSEMTDHDRRRPYVVSMVLSRLTQLRPEKPIVARLVDDLLAMRKSGDATWFANPFDRAPSIVHTARAVNALRTTLAWHTRQDVIDAVESGTEAILSWTGVKNETPDFIPIDAGRSDVGINVQHFGPAHILITLAGFFGSKSPPRQLLEAEDEFWSEYSPEQKVWRWSRDDRNPLWMTFDAVSTLREISSARPTPLHPSFQGASRDEHPSFRATGGSP